MATVGEIGVNVTANTTKLDQGLKRSQMSVKRFASGVRGGVSSLNMLGPAGIAAAAGIGALTLAVRELHQQFDELDKLAKASAKLGIDPTQLEGLRMAANRTGVELKTLEDGLQRMVRGISEAAQGTGTAKGALEELGIPIERIIDLSPDQQFAMISDAMRRVDREADKLRLTYEVFGRSGVNLKNTLALGSAQLDLMAKKSEQLGLGIDRETLGKVEQYNDALAAMTDALRGLRRQLAAFAALPASRIARGLEMAMGMLAAGGIGEFGKQEAVAFANQFMTDRQPRPSSLPPRIRPNQSAALAVGGVGASVAMGLEAFRMMDLERAKRSALMSLVMPDRGLGGGGINAAVEQGSREEFALEAQRRRDRTENELRRIQTDQLREQINAAKSLRELEKLAKDNRELSL